MEGCFMFQWEVGGVGGVFQMGGFIFKWGVPHGGSIGFGVGVSKNHNIGGGMPPPTLGNPDFISH